MSDRDYAYVRTSDAPVLPPPPSQTGVFGWLWQNMLSSMANFSSIGASIQSLAMILLTVTIAYLFVTGVWGLVNFTLIDAIWVDADGKKRLACATTAQGGALPEDWYGACWPFISAKWKLIVYGRFPETELWRVNLVFLGLAFGVTWLTRDAIPSRRVTGLVLLALAALLGAWYQFVAGELFYTRVGVQILALIGVVLMLAPSEGGNRLVAIFMLAIFPVIALILLSGGHFEVENTTWMIWIPIVVIMLVVGQLGMRGMLGEAGEALGGAVWSLGLVLAAVLVAVFVCSVDFGLEHVETSKWGGLLVTLVVALTGIVASLPLGIVLALGRRSSLPIIRIMSVVFIEFWRGVPLITVLFMSSVMLPLFLPEGTEFNKLLRALIGVALFSSAYMAEVVRGGLQAIPKGQYEGAMALGLPFWNMMNLIILPQALTLVIPGIVNTFIGLFKDTTLVLIIGLFDLLGQMQSVFTDASWSTPVQSSTGYVTVAFMFFIFCFGMSRYSMYTEKRLRRGHAR